MDSEVCWKHYAFGTFSPFPTITTCQVQIKVVIGQGLHFSTILQCPSIPLTNFGSNPN